MAVDYKQYIDFHGETWRAIVAWAEESKKSKIGLLIGADSHDKSNQIRGSLLFINELLALEKAATLAANSGQPK